MRRLILLPLVAAVVLVGCDGGVLGGGKIENFGGYSNCYYQGGIKDTFAHGKGAVYCFIEGRGLVKHFENEFCYGEFKPCARGGTYTGGEYADDFKLVYDGEWKDGKYDGQGTFYQYGNIRYKGEWMQGRRNGQGVSYNRDSSIDFEGEWKEDKKWTGRGEGSWTSLNNRYGSKYVGEWQNGKPHGQGISVDNHDRIEFRGTWKQGKRHGQGISYNEDGRIGFEGEWKEDEKWTGRGAERYEIGRRDDDGMGITWLNKRNGSTYPYYQLFYIGDFKDGKPNGQGSLGYSGNYKYTGEFKDGKLHGQGTFCNVILNHHPCVIYFQGEWRHGFPHTSGTAN